MKSIKALQQAEEELGNKEYLRNREEAIRSGRPHYFVTPRPSIIDTVIKSITKEI